MSSKLGFMNKSRRLKDSLITASESILGRIIVLTGARQVGKTTLLKSIFPDYTYLSLDDPTLRRDLANLTADQWAKNFPKAILDEVQKMPELFDIIKAVYDKDGQERYILSGSSQILLLQKVRESLAGRCTIFEMFPLILPEQLTQNGFEPPANSFFQQILLDSSTENMPSFRLERGYESKLEAFEYYLKYGGYPSLIAHRLKEREKIVWLRDYVKTYLERDVRDLADFRKLEPFVAMQRVCAAQTGQLINYSSLAREAGIQSATAQKFLYYLSISYQIIMLSPWHKNKLKRLSKMPKLHFLDIGIQRTLTQNTSGILNGNEFETAVVSEIFKQAKSLEIDCHFYHLRTSDGREVDLLIELEKGYIAIEIKQATHISQTDARHLRNLDEILDKPIIASFVLSNDNQVKELGANIKAMHAAHFLT